MTPNADPTGTTLGPSIRPELAQRALGPPPGPMTPQAVPATRKPRFFTMFGTILGGIWADQSWGRFWGWDPKENGALLIVLWLLRG